jgi:uncharacterized protein
MSAKAPHVDVLIVPGLGNSGVGHWQTIWEKTRSDCRRVELGQWDKPHRNSWVNQLNLAIHAAQGPVVLVGHSLGCLAIAWWASMERPAPGGKVIGALLVAPPEVDFFPLDERLEGFAPTPRAPLPFPSILVASHNDPYISFRTARQLARDWGSTLADAGAAGHINAASGLGAWEFGQFLLSQLTRKTADQPARTAPGRTSALTSTAIDHLSD